MWLLSIFLICEKFYETKLLHHGMEMFACDLGHLSATQRAGLLLWKSSSSGMQSALCLLRVSVAANDLRQHLTLPYLQKSL